MKKPALGGFEHSVPGTGLEPAHPFEYYNLNIARLPISPSGQLNCTANLQKNTIFAFD